jgi:Ca-activated chloride channel homolog
MTFEPVVPAAILAVIAVAVIATRLITMRQLMNARTGRATVLRWCGLTLALLLLLIAAARPVLAPSGKVAAPQGNSSNANVFFIVDRSVASAVTDWGDGEPRIAGMRADIATLIRDHPRARFAVIGFASRPSLDWPLSDDAFSLDPVVARLAPYADQTPDAQYQVNAAAAANVLRYQLIASGQQYPGSKNLVFYLGSGARNSRAPQGEFDTVAGSVDGGSVLGYGALDEPELTGIAGQLGVPYVHRQDGQPIPESSTAAPPSTSAAGSDDVAERRELYWVFTSVAAVLLLAELYASLREFRRSRMARPDVVRNEAP